MQAYGKSTTAPTQAPTRSCLYQSASLASSVSVGTTSDCNYPELIAAEDTCGHQRDRRTPASSPPHPVTTAFQYPPVRPLRRTTSRMSMPRLFPPPTLTPFLPPPSVHHHHTLAMFCILSHSRALFPPPQTKQSPSNNMSAPHNISPPAPDPYLGSPLTKNV